MKMSSAKLSIYILIHIFFQIWTTVPFDIKCSSSQPSQINWNILNFNEKRRTYGLDLRMYGIDLNIYDESKLCLIT